MRPSSSGCWFWWVSLSRHGSQDADEAGVRTKILELEHAWNQAEAFNDLMALDSLFDNRPVYIDSDGTMMTKAAFLSHVKTSHLQQVTQSMSVQVFGDVAIVRGRIW